MKRRVLLAAIAILASAVRAPGEPTVTLIPLDPHQAEAFEIRSTGRLPATQEQSFPAGAPFQLRSGHKVWLEGDFLISPFAYTRKDLAEGESTSMPVAAAGLVTVPGFRGSDRPRAIWLLSLVPPFEGETPRHELSRFLEVSETDGGVLMPAGATVAGLWDVRSHHFVALGEPFQVVAGEAVEAALAQPDADRSSLVIRLERAELIEAD